MAKFVNRSREIKRIYQIQRNKQIQAPADTEISTGKCRVMIDDIHAESSKRISQGFAVTKITHKTGQRCLCYSGFVRKYERTQLVNSGWEKLPDSKGKHQKTDCGHDLQAVRMLPRLLKHSQV